MPLLVSGFLFCLACYPVRFLTARFDGQRLFFSVITLGMVFLGAGAVLYGQVRVPIHESVPFLANMSTSVRGVLGFRSPGAICTAIAIALLLALLVNTACGLTLSRRKGWGRLIDGWGGVVRFMTAKFGDPMQQTLVRAVTQQRLVQVCLKGGRVYIGLVYRIPSRAHVETAYVELQTHYSLQRQASDGKFPAETTWTKYPGVVAAKLRWERETMKTLKETVMNRTDIRAQAKRTVIGKIDIEIAEISTQIAGLEDGLKGVSAEDWIRVIPVTELETLAFFDPEVFKRF
ncbi:hypothetical protein [Luteimonas sp. SDU101]|uniref:hypothetical protein n=1 Tax=Luteimonas sp. SDU101 TaxID=3422593 RepID=UPI003EB793F9